MMEVTLRLKLPRCQRHFCGSVLLSWLSCVVGSAGYYHTPKLRVNTLVQILHENDTEGT